MKFFLHVDKDKNCSDHTRDGFCGDLEECGIDTKFNKTLNVVSFIDYDEEHIHKFVNAKDMSIFDIEGFLFDDIYGEENIPIDLYEHAIRRKKNQNTEKGYF